MRAFIALLSSKRTNEELEKNREFIVLTVENFLSFVIRKDVDFPTMRKNRGYALAETEKTCIFSKEPRELSLTQQDDSKSVFPAHLVLFDSATGQPLIGQRFHMPKIHELSYISAPSIRGFRGITYQYRTPEKQEFWKKLLAILCIHYWRGTEPESVEREANSSTTMITFRRRVQNKSSHSS